MRSLVLVCFVVAVVVLGMDNRVAMAATSGFTPGVVMTGPGSYDYGRDRFVLDVTLSGRFHGHVRYTR